MRFTGGAVGHKSTQDATKAFSPDELGDDHECEMGAQEERFSDPDDETGDCGAVEIGDRDGDIIDEGDDDAEIEEEIEYGYRMANNDVESEDEPEDEGDEAIDGDIDLGPEDGEECWEEGVLELEEYAAL